MAVVDVVLADTCGFVSQGLVGIVVVLQGLAQVWVLVMDAAQGGNSF